MAKDDSDGFEFPPLRRVQQQVQVGAVSEVAACQGAEDEDAMPLLLQLPGRRPRDVDRASASRGDPIANDPVEEP